MCVAIDMVSLQARTDLLQHCESFTQAELLSPPPHSRASSLFSVLLHFTPSHERSAQAASLAAG